MLMIQTLHVSSSGMLYGSCCFILTGEVRGHWESFQRLPENSPPGSPQALILFMLSVESKNQNFQAVLTSYSLLDAAYHPPNLLLGVILYTLVRYFTLEGYSGWRKLLDAFASWI